MKFLNRYFFVGAVAGAMLAVGLPLVALGVIGVMLDSGKPTRVPVGLPPLSFPNEILPLDWEVRGIDGRPANVAELEHAVLFVNNWATWCGPCLQEIPAIEELVGTYRGQDVAFVIVSDEPLDKVRDFVADQGWELPFYVTRNRPPMFQTRVIPSTFILDDDRRIVYTHVGSGAWGGEAPVQFIDKLLAGEHRVSI